MTKSRHINAPRHRWTQAELELVRLHYADTPTRELAAALGCKENVVHNRARLLGVRKSREYVAEQQRRAMANPEHGGRKAMFAKGHVPANKGVKRPPGWAPGRMSSSQFTPHTLPHNTLPVGSYRVNSDGYVELKFQEAPGPWKMRWVPLHRKVWSDAHGPIPRGHVVVFRPGRHTTEPERVTLDALELITQAANMRRNSIHNLPPELAQVMHLRGALNRQINRQINQRSETP